ncbi:MAG TPA: nicotinate-nucleotide adenylyltransferase [Thiotrichaceae bacterium]|jgi:nicotinate-nucleotide adenylyltransferase|nr:nicotinate-nucleotide adenylyltransferase [Thiotrichaceae bacterium]HIM07532.1 nicotinate-nucleotide adenylyltransferase [Gammaproteobacteria bacterium]
MQLIGILGGTFDPIHNGHIRLALEAQEQLKLNQVRLIPVNIPPHRSIPVVSTEHRLAMMQLATENESTLSLDLRELESEEISFTINTLKSLRQEFTDNALCLIVGIDAFNKIDSWKDWQDLLDYAHIIVANRPDSLANKPTNDISPVLQRWIEKYQITDHTQLKNNLSGNIVFINIPMLDISSSMIRQLNSEHKTLEDLLPNTIQTYIKDNHLYLDSA